MIVLLSAILFFQVPDIFPLLRYAELHPRESSNAKHSSKNVVTGKAKEWLVPPDEQGRYLLSAGRYQPNCFMYTYIYIYI